MGSGELRDVYCGYEKQGAEEERKRKRERGNRGKIKYRDKEYIYYKMTLLGEKVMNGFVDGGKRRIDFRRKGRRRALREKGRIKRPRDKIPPKLKYT